MSGRHGYVPARDVPPALVRRAPGRAAARPPVPPPSPAVRRLRVWPFVLFLVFVALLLLALRLIVLAPLVIAAGVLLRRLYVSS